MEYERENILTVKYKFKLSSVNKPLNNSNKSFYRFFMIYVVVIDY